jgi:hypothetical protein
METCIKEIKKFNLKEELNRTSIEIRKAESENNFEKLNSLTKKFRELSKKIII